MASSTNLIQRYARNEPTITHEEQQILANKRVCICGCGGIGGYAVELLARAGVGTLIAVDGDTFESSNLNRQLLSREDNLGQPKALAAKERVEAINSDVEVLAYAEFITEKNVSKLLAGCDVVVDALDSSKTRLQLEDWCSQTGVPLIHGAIAGWYAQVTTIAPGPHVLKTIYPAADEEIGPKPGAPSFAPALCASLQVAECLKVLLGKGEPLYNKLLVVDLLRNTRRVIDL
ncbi:MAG: HesA/MoeB/ThiF family protein [Eggerthellaceae bacterium]|nr:HesA/MoeB/ThiF family protein [Eggerthellaceae bacterium]